VRKRDSHSIVNNVTVTCAATRLAPATSAPRLGPPLPHLRRDSARACHICAATRPAPATSAPGLGSRLPHLHWDWATSAPGLGPPLPHLRRDSAHRLDEAKQGRRLGVALADTRRHGAIACRIWPAPARINVAPAATRISRRRLDEVQDLHQDSADHPSHICAGTGLTPATSAPRLR
jgi:hypothetical protein